MTWLGEIVVTRIVFTAAVLATIVLSSGARHNCSDHLVFTAVVLAAIVFSSVSILWVQPNPLYREIRCMMMDGLNGPVAPRHLAQAVPRFF